MPTLPRTDSAHRQNGERLPRPRWRRTLRRGGAAASLTAGLTVLAASLAPAALAATTLTTNTTVASPADCTAYGGDQYGSLCTFYRGSALDEVTVSNGATLTIGGAGLTDVAAFNVTIDPGATVYVARGSFFAVGTLANNGTVRLACGTSIGGTATSGTGTVVQDACPPPPPADTTPPTLKPTVTPNPVLLNGTATATPNADATAVTSSCGPVSTSTVGTSSVTCTATDQANNTATASATYRVVYGGFTGFQAPVDDGGVYNAAKAGQTIPLKWTLTDAKGAPVTTLTSAKVTTTAVSCSGGAPVDDVEAYSTATTSGLQNLGGGAYQYNWKTTKSLAGSCVKVDVDLGDGVAHTALFAFK